MRSEKWSDSALRVLMVNWVYAPEFSGAAAQCRTLAAQLTSQGVKVDVLTGTNLPGCVGTDSVDDITVHRVLCDKSSLWKSCKYAMDIFHYVLKNRKRYDIIHSHGFSPQALLAARIVGLPFISKITNLKVDDPLAVRKRFLGSLLLKLYSKADAVIATSSLLAEISKNVLPPSTVVKQLPNGVDVSRFSPAALSAKKAIRKKLGIGQNDFILLYVGTICHTKGLDLLVKALEILTTQKVPRFKLLVVGPDEYVRSFGDNDAKVEVFAKQIRQDVEDSYLCKKIRFEGKRDNVEDYYKAADVLIHPSRREGQPNAIIEAMASALPVIANNIPGITSDMVTHNYTGYVVECEDILKLAHSIKKMMADKILRLEFGRNARAVAMSRYDIHNIASQYAKLYRNIVTRRSIDYQLVPEFKLKASPASA